MPAKPKTVREQIAFSYSQLACAHSALRSIAGYCPPRQMRILERAIQGFTGCPLPRCGEALNPGWIWKLPQQVYGQPWHDASEPNDQREREWWGMRAALLDCFVYARPGK